MKKLVAAFLALTVLSALTAIAAEPAKDTPNETAPQKPKLEQSDTPHTYKKCMKICKEEVGDADKCERICVTLKK